MKNNLQASKWQMLGQPKPAASQTCNSCWRKLVNAFRASL